MDSDILKALLPLIVLQLILLVAALADLRKRDKVTGGNKLVWFVVIVFLNILGPILYFTIGRKEQ